MRKTLCMSVLFLFALSFVVFASGKSEGQAASGDQPIKIVMGGGSIGGSGLAAAVAWTEKVKAAYPGSAIDVLPGSTLQNILRLANGDLDFGLVTTSELTKAYKGVTPPKEFEKPLTNLRGINIFWNQYYQFVVPKNFNASTIDEVFDKKMKLKICPGGKRGDFGTLATQQMLKDVWNLTFEDIEAWGGQVIYTDFTEAVQMIKDGQLDMFSPLTAAPNATIMELTTLSGVKLLPMGDKTVKAMVANGYPEVSLPKGTYKGVDADIRTVAAPYGAAVRADIPDDVVYRMTKVLCENDAQMRAVSATLKNFYPENFKGLSIPLHPGAEKYYKEKGLIK